MSCSINLKNISYKDKVLKDVFLNLGHEEKIAIIGANGSGKSTLLKIIAGFIEPSNGYIELFHNITILVINSLSLFKGLVRNFPLKFYEI